MMKMIHQRHQVNLFFSVELQNQRELIHAAHQLSLHPSMHLFQAHTQSPSPISSEKMQNSRQPEQQNEEASILEGHHRHNASDNWLLDPTSTPNQPQLGSVTTPHDAAVKVHLCTQI